MVVEIELIKDLSVNKIQMVDLKGQYKKIKNQIDTAVIQTIESTSFINGPIVKEFAKSLEDYLRCKACNSLC